MNYLTNYYKNLSEQLQEQVNQLEHVLQTLKESEPDPRAEMMDLHHQIAMDIAHVHSEVAPHISRNLGSHNYDVALSQKDLEKQLMSDYFTKDPFTSHRDALAKIGGQFLPPVIYPQGTKNPHWGKQDVIELDFGSGEIHPHKEELVLDKIEGALEKKLNRRLD